MTTATLTSVADGERRKLDAHALLAARRAVYVLRGRRALLAALLDRGVLIKPNPVRRGNAGRHINEKEDRKMHDTPTPSRRRLTDILNGGTDSLRAQWAETRAAADFSPLPGGNYIAHVHSADLYSARTGTPGVKVRFDVAEGEYAGRVLFHDLWLTPAALPQTKRDCLKLGLDSLEKLEADGVLPGRIRCKVRVALRTDDDGTQRNRVRGFDVRGIDEPPCDPFAPADDAPDAPAADDAAAPTAPLTATPPGEKGGTGVPF